MVDRIDLEKIVALRKHYQITQEEAAKALDIGRVTYIMREKNGSFTDDELNKLSKLLNVERSEFVKKEEPRLLNRLFQKNFIEMHSMKSFNPKYSRLKLDELKEELAEDVNETIGEPIKVLNESESMYQSKYMSLLEDQLREREKMVKELRETLIRLEAETKLMFEKVNDQFLEFCEEIKFQLDENRDFAIKAMEQLNEETKEQQQKVSDKLSDFDFLLQENNKFLIIDMKDSPKLSPQLIKEQLKLYLHAMEELSSKEFAKATKKK